MWNNLTSVCVFCASGQHVDDSYHEAARELGRRLAEHGWLCVNGGGAMGLMRGVSDGAMDAGGQVLGVIPKFMVDNGWCYDRLEQVLITADMHERKQQMQDVADAIVALPGGCGTLEELLEVITWRQLGIITKPVVILNVGGYYDPLIAMLDRCVEQQFMKASHATLWSVAATAREAVDIIASQLENGVPAADSKL